MIDSIVSKKQNLKKQCLEKKDTIGDGSHILTEGRLASVKKNLFTRLIHMYFCKIPDQHQTLHGSANVTLHYTVNVYCFARGLFCAMV